MADSQSSNPITVIAAPVNGNQLTRKDYVDAGDAAKVDKAGDTMTGALFQPVGQVISSDNQVTTKEYVDDQIDNIDVDATDVDVTPAGNISSTNVQAALQELDTEKLALSGGTMTGILILNASPTGASPSNQAATKAYAESMGSKEISQPMPLTLWEVYHGYNRPVNLMVYNESNVAVYGQIEQHLTDPLNYVKIRFSNAFSGKVVVS